MTGVLSPDAKATLGWPFSFALNRLLAAEPAARARLAPFAGSALELRAPPLPSLRFVILPGGMLEAGGEDPALVVTLRPGAMNLEGDARLAAEVVTLLRQLRWDPEEGLSRLVGDVAAHRLAAVARGLAAWPADAARRFAEGLADYAVEEKRLLVSQRELADFSAQVRGLCDAVERLEKRVRGLG